MSVFVIERRAVGVRSPCPSVTTVHLYAVRRARPRVVIG